MPQVLLVGAFDPGRLETSYSRAFTVLGWDVRHLDLPALVRAESRLGPVGRAVFQRITIEPWVRRVGSKTVAEVRALTPDLIVLFGIIDHLNAGALAQIRTIISTKVGWIWPDTMVNWSNGMSAMLPLVDVVGTYSQASVASFRAMGAKKAIWLPLAADPALHGLSDAAGSSTIQPHDVTFIGNWRPAREQLLDQLGDFDLKIWGHGWDRRARSSQLVRRALQGSALFGSDLAKTVRASKVNLNIIDPSNYPAANMRVFEVLMAGGLELCSPCPEMEASLRHDEHLYYFQDGHDLPTLVDRLLRRPDDRARVTLEGNREVNARHTYVDRANTLVEACALRS